MIAKKPILSILVLASVYLAGCAAPPSGPEPTALPQGNGQRGPPGLEWRGEWSATTAYRTTEAVHHQGTSYVALGPSRGVPPDSDPTTWGVLALKGDDGEIGPAGPQGPAGEPGATGPQGPIGPAGPQGVRGPAGAPGPVVTWHGAWSPATTYAKYDVVGHEGGSWLLVAASSTNEAPDATPAAWVLLAAQGETGPTGPQGARGEQGIQGPQGEIGPQGPQGEVGPQGSQGAQGIQGAQGGTGPQGPQGAQGPAGPAGLAWRAAWSAATTYAQHDGVQHEGSSFVALAASTNVVPGTDATKWSLLAEGGTADAPALGWSVAQGGTGLTAAATGDMIYASGVDAYARLPAAAAGNVLLSGTLPSWGQVSLAAGGHVTGILPAANGGTGANDVQFTKSGSTVRTFTVPDVSDTLAVLNTAQTWGAAQYFFQGISVNALARTGNYTMSNTDTAIFLSPDAATQWVELPCATTVGAGRLAVVKKMNTLYSIYVAGCPPGTEKIDNQNVITLPSAYRGSIILMSRGTSNGWVIIGSHGLAED